MNEKPEKIVYTVEQTLKAVKVLRVLAVLADIACIGALVFFAAINLIWVGGFIAFPLMCVGMFLRAWAKAVWWWQNS